DAVRRLAGEPPDAATTEAVSEALREHGARPWQIELTAPAIAEALDSM
ncbi:MAG: ribonuclease D, partial [Actinomycetia bacterium]|nr:ribonuclease D [Actinomycetes bacterium]